MEQQQNQNNNVVNEQVEENTNDVNLGGEPKFESCFSQDEIDINSQKLDEELSTRDAKLYSDFTQDIGAPTADYEELTNLFIQNAALPEGKKSLMDKVAEKGPEFRQFFDRYVSNYTTVYPSEDLTSILNDIKLKDVVNTWRYGDKELFSKALDLKDKMSSKGGVSNAVILAKFINGTSSGNTVSVPLWHSGFRVTINPPTVAELTTLHMQVVKSEVDLGRETLSLTTAANRSTTIDIIKEFIREKIYRTTLDIDTTTTDIFQYISILDFDFLLLGLISATYVNKISTVRTCVNTLRSNSGDELGCSHSVSADLDPNKLVIVDKSILTPNMIATISKRSSGTVSIAERSNYLSELNKALDSRRERIGEYQPDGGNSVITFRIPSVQAYVQDGLNWVEDAMADLTRLAENASYQRKQVIAEKIKDVRGGTIMSANVEAIGEKVNDESIVSTDRGTIYQALKGITNSIDIVNGFFEAVNKYVNRSYIAICATPNYICPQCRKIQEGIKTPADFDAFIPLNVLDFFLTLVEVKIAKTQYNTKATL